MWCNARVGARSFYERAGLAVHGEPFDVPPIGMHLLMSTEIGERGVMRAARLVIFDCDGVLVDSEPLSNGVLSRLLAEEGLELTLAQTRAAYQGMTLAQVLAERRREHRAPAGSAVAGAL